MNERNAETAGLTLFGLAIAGLFICLSFNGRGCEEAQFRSETEKHRISVQAKKEIIMACVRETRSWCGSLKELDP